MISATPGKSINGRYETYFAYLVLHLYKVSSMKIIKRAVNSHGPRVITMYV